MKTKTYIALAKETFLFEWAEYFGEDPRGPIADNIERLLVPVIEQATTEMHKQLAGITKRLSSLTKEIYLLYGEEYISRKAMERLERIGKFKDGKLLRGKL